MYLNNYCRLYKIRKTDPTGNRLEEFILLINNSKKIRVHILLFIV
jgi:hypothetical protein